MLQLIELIEKCASSAVSAQPDDLPALSQLHTDILAAQSMAAEEGQSPQDRLPAQFGQSAEQIAILLEKLVLHDVDDATATMREVGRQIQGLQGLLEGSDSPAPAKAAGETPAFKPAKSPGGGCTAAPIMDEREITENDVAMALEFVGEAIGHLDAAETSLLKLEDDPGDADEVNAVFRAFHTIKGVAGFLELRQIGALAHAAETLLDLARKDKIKLAGPRLDVVLEARDMLGQMVAAVDLAAKSRQAPGRQEGLQNLLKRLEAATQAGDLPAGEKIAEKRTEPASSAAPEVTGKTPAPLQASSAPVEGSGQAGGESVVKVATGRLDALVNSVGELVIAQAMVAQDLGNGVSAGDQRLARNLSHLGKITRGLQELSMSMRMVPIAGVFQKMARLARDVGRKAGKDVDFVQVGGETELDRNVVEAISDPLIHMVRNSIDHGLENPQDREKAGKPRAGKVVLKACHQAGNVVVEITDDGRGLNQPRIVQKAIAAGLVKEGQELTEQQIFQLIFHPGLSTAEKVTDISGRGVGMDVVRKNVEALRGRIEIASTAGKGSTFTVRLPLTLAVIDGLIVKVGTERYIIPITSIEQSIRPTAAQLSSVGGKGELCMVRERLLPMVRLHRLFNVVPRTEDPTAALVVIVQEGSHRCCLLVDQLIGQQQVVIKSVGKEIGQLQGIAGCAILGDGNVSLILDVAGIIHSALH